MHPTLRSLSLIMLLSTSGTATATTVHPDSTAVLLDSFVVSVDVAPSIRSINSVDFDLTGSGTLKIEETMFVWSTNDRIDLIGDVPTIRANAADIDYMSASEIANVLSGAAVDSALSFGYFEPIDSLGAATTVYHARCVERSGSGSGSSFAAASQGLGGRTYLIGGLPSHIITPSGTISCSPSCEANNEKTCD